MEHVSLKLALEKRQVLEIGEEGMGILNGGGDRNNVVKVEKWVVSFALNKIYLGEKFTSD